MTSNELEEVLGDAEDAFQRKPASPEVGLERVSDPATLQLRKACRLLDAAGFLLDRNGHFTVIIETSFVAVERSIQFYVERSEQDRLPVRATQAGGEDEVRWRCCAAAVRGGCGSRLGVGRS